MTLRRRAPSAFALSLALAAPLSAWAQSQAPAPFTPGQQQQTKRAEEIFTPELPNFAMADPVLRDDRRIFVFMPKGETEANWRERVVLLVYLNVKDRDPVQVAERLQGEWRNLCADLMTHPPVSGMQKEYKAAQFTMDCRQPAPGNPGQLKKREFVSAKVIQGRDSLYLVQRAWHGDQGEPPPLSDKAVGADWTGFFQQIEVCDSRIAGQACAALAPKTKG